MKLLFDTEWFEIIQDLSTEKRVEIMEAILAFPNKDSNTSIWKNVIKPKLEYQLDLYNKKCAQFAKNREKRWEQTPDNKEQTSNTCLTDVCKTSNRRENVNVNEYIYNNNINNNSVLQTTRTSKFTPPTLQDVLDYAKQQSSMIGVGGFSCPQKIATEFWTHYDSQGWVKSNDAKTPVTNWKSLLRSWTLNPNKFSRVGVAAPADYDLPL